LLSIAETTTVTVNFWFGTTCENWIFVQW